MGVTLEALHHLAQIDQQLRAARETIESKRRSARGTAKRIADFEKQIEQTHQQIKMTQAEADRQELDRKTRDAHAAKLREALNRAKTNKEYAAILAELNTEKADLSKREDTVLAALTKVDEIRKQESQLRESLDKEKQRLAEVERAAAALEAQLAGQIATLEKDRADASQALSPDIIALFNRAADQNDGDALVTVQRIHPKREDFVCGGCNMGIPLEVVNALKTRDEVKQCNVCLRILYLERDARVGVGSR